MALTAPQDEPDSEDERFVFKRRKKNREKQAKRRALLKTDPNRIQDLEKFRQRRKHENEIARKRRQMARQELDRLRRQARAEAKGKITKSAKAKALGERNRQNTALNHLEQVLEAAQSDHRFLKQVLARNEEWRRSGKDPEAKLFVRQRYVDQELEAHSRCFNAASYWLNKHKEETTEINRRANIRDLTDEATNTTASQAGY